MSEVELTPEITERLEKLADKLSNPDVIRLERESIESVMRMVKDGFDMIDRTLSITESLHASETKKIDILLDIIKYLSPILATALITGMTVDIPNIKPQILTWIGSIGFIAMIVLLFVLISIRSKISDRQTEHYNKLNKVFSDWQKIAEIQKQISNPYIDDINDDMRPLMEEVFKMQDEYKKDKK